MNRFYVYEHWRPDLDTCFWVGKGTGDRAYRFKRNADYDAIIAALAQQGLCAEVRIVRGTMTAIDALRLECERIAFWRQARIVLTNRTNGGSGSGKAVSEATRLKLRLANLGKKHSPETRAKRSASLKKAIREGRKLAGRRPGFKHSLETRAKMGASLAGQPRSPELREKLRAANLGKKHTTETRAKMAAAHLRRTAPYITGFPKGARRPESTKKKMSDAQKGHRVSEKTRAKLSAIAKIQDQQRDKANGRFRASIPSS